MLVSNMKAHYNTVIQLIRDIIGEVFDESDSSDGLPTAS